MHSTFFYWVLILKVVMAAIKIPFSLILITAKILYFCKIINHIVSLIAGRNVTALHLPDSTAITMVNVGIKSYIQVSYVMINSELQSICNSQGIGKPKDWKWVCDKTITVTTLTIKTCCWDLNTPTTTTGFSCFSRTFLRTFLQRLLSKMMEIITTETLVSILHPKQTVS